MWRVVSIDCPFFQTLSTVFFLGMYVSVRACVWDVSEASVVVSGWWYVHSAWDGTFTSLASFFEIILSMIFDLVLIPRRVVRIKIVGHQFPQLITIMILGRLTYWELNIQFICNFFQLITLRISIFNVGRLRKEAPRAFNISPSLCLRLDSVILRHWKTKKKRGKMTREL